MIKKRDKMFSKIRVFIECIRTVYSKYVALAITTLWGSTRNLPLTKTENVSKPKISPEQFPPKILIRNTNALRKPEKSKFK